MVKIKGKNGVEIDIDASIASALVRVGDAEYVGGKPESKRAAKTAAAGTVTEPTAIGDKAIDESTTKVVAPITTADNPKLERPAGRASKDAWADYAAATGVVVEGDLGRDEIRALVVEAEEAKKPKE